MATDLRFDLPPQKALDFFRAKGLAPSFAWQDTWQAEHDAAFTVAKMANLDLLRDTKAAVDKAIAEGQTFAQFREGIEGRLVQAGWWGKGEVVDPATGEKKLVELGSPRRLRTIFRVNMQTAYAAGHWQQIEDNKAEAPYLMYDAVDDDRTREEHAEWDGTVLPVGDAWWSSHMPPNGWNCRCSVIQLSGDELEALGLAVADKAPSSSTREYTNPRTGEVSEVPQGVDPGWGYNPGASVAGRVGDTTDALLDKAATAPADIGARAIKQLSPAEITAFDAVHSAWVDEVLGEGTPRSSWRIVGGLSVEELQYFAAKGAAPSSAAITVDSKHIVGRKAARHEAAGDALTAKDWKAVPAGLREPQAVLFDKATGNLHYVLPTLQGSKAPRLVVAVDFVTKSRRVNSVRSAFRISVNALADRNTYELVRGEVK